MAKHMLTVDDLHVVFHTPLGDVRAVSGVSFQIEKGQIYGIVGESGCGKSVTGQSILRLIQPPGEIVRGHIFFDGEDIIRKSDREMEQLRGIRISMIFQDPSAALNPLFTVSQQLMGIMKRHNIAKGDKLYQRAVQLLTDMDLPNPEDLLHRYPHELSGGMQQRVMIAMALSTDPDLIIADEPTSALDVTIQSQILDLLLSLQQERNLTIMLITHDLGVVAETCKELAVFYLGRIVEQGLVKHVFRDPKHPYTQGLLAALPTLDPETRGSTLKVIPGTVPTLLTPINHCAFATRCEYAMEICFQKKPDIVFFNNKHLSACHLYTDKAKRDDGGRR